MVIKFEREDGDLDRFLLEKYNMQDHLVMDLLLEDSEGTKMQLAPELKFMVAFAFLCRVLLFVRFLSRLVFYRIRRRER